MGAGLPEPEESFTLPALSTEFDQLLMTSDTGYSFNLLQPVHGEAVGPSNSWQAGREAADIVGQDTFHQVPGLAYTTSGASFQQLQGSVGDARPVADADLQRHVLFAIPGCFQIVLEFGGDALRINEAIPPTHN
ncbi:uncharacterized protein EI90DRAFT_3119162 [Cantharellus anzutake]|uniref:uncharacterized protein n=1 Tax=Cantharellus anzutake TaxID=1750568 RepID=UPI0019087F0E|nr:uncharacterized protein EI90DRAFT_3119162 [Cantharellus anzutake]KAF8336826.1 hypothetical protein EI90DRAFT_3119162 [Cantharellus anzutake]